MNNYDRVIVTIIAAALTTISVTLLYHTFAEPDPAQAIPVTITNPLPETPRSINVSVDNLPRSFSIDNFPQSLSIDNFHLLPSIDINSLPTVYVEPLSTVNVKPSDARPFPVTIRDHLGR